MRTQTTATSTSYGRRAPIRWVPAEAGTSPAAGLHAEGVVHGVGGGDVAPWVFPVQACQAAVGLPAADQRVTGGGRRDLHQQVVVLGSPAGVPPAVAADTVKERTALEAAYQSGTRPWMLWDAPDRDPLQATIAGLQEKLER